MRDKGREGVKISHLLLQMTLVFYEGSQDQMTYLYWLLMCFEAILRLKINLDKSELIPMGGMDNIDVLALEWVVSLPLIWVFR